MNVTPFSQLTISDTILVYTNLPRKYGSIFKNGIVQKDMSHLCCSPWHLYHLVWVLVQSRCLRINCLMKEWMVHQGGGLTYSSLGTCLSSAICMCTHGKLLISSKYVWEFAQWRKSSILARENFLVCWQWNQMDMELRHGFSAILCVQWGRQKTQVPPAPPRYRPYLASKD